MSLQSELTHLQANVASVSSAKDDIMTALASKGVTVPAGATLHDVPNLIGQINGMAPSNLVTIGGRTYKTVIIGNQEWLAENLDYKFDVNGNQIPIGVSGTPTTPSAWYYNNNETTYGREGKKYGLLYNWYAVKLLNDNRASLIPGWHVPTFDEWTALLNSVGGYLVAGTKLKAANVDWAPSWGGTDDYGFTVFPAGYRFSGSFYDVGNFSFIWTSTGYSAAFSYDCCFDTSANATLSYHNKENGYSIRLVKDS